MPRAFDRGIPEVDKNPLRTSLDFNDPQGVIAEAAQDFGSVIRDGLVGVLRDITGIDLSSVETLIQSIGGVLQTLIDWLNEILNLDDFLAALGEVGGFFVELLDRTGFLAVLDEVITFFTDLADRSGFLDMLSQVIDFFLGLLNPATFLTTLQSVIDFFGDLLDLDGFLAMLGDVIDFFLGLLNPAGFLDMLRDVVDFFATILDFSGWTAALKQFVDFFAGLLNPSGWLGMLDDVVNFFATILNFPAWSAALKTFVDFFAGLLNPSGWLTIVNDVANFVATIVNWPAWSGLLKQVIDFFGTVGTFSTWSAVFKQVIDFFAGLLNLPAWLGVFENVVDFFGGILNFSTWSSVLKQVIDWFVGLADGLVDGVLGIGEWLGGITVFGQSLIDGLWSAVSGGAAAIGKTIEDALTAVGDWAVSLTRDLTGFDFGDIGTWARNLLGKGLGWQGLFDLFGSIPAGILGVLPIPAINLTNPELMARGGFDTEATLTPSSGWSWDGTQRYPVTATTGGSAKVLGAATTRALYANQSIEVAAADKLIIGCYVKSTGTVGTGGIRIDVVEFNGTTQGATVPIAQRNSSSNWVYLGNTSAAPYTVGAGVTSIRVKLSITVAAANGSTVWFDAISVKKTGLLDGSWMEGILQGAGTVVGDLQGIVDGVKSGIEEAVSSGNPLTAIKTSIETIFNGLFGLAFMPLNVFAQPLLDVAIPPLSATKIDRDTVSLDVLPVEGIGDELGTAITTGSGGKMSRRNITTKVTAGSGNGKFIGSFYVTDTGASGVDQISDDITPDHVNGRFTVTHAGYYMVEVSFTTNASTPAAGYFNVAPAVYLNGSTTPYKVGADSLGSFGGGFGNYSRAAHSTFIVYIPAGGNVQAGYVNFGALNANFFEGDTNGNSTYFSISMLNRTAEG